MDHDYKRHVRDLSLDILTFQKNLHVLQMIAWDPAHQADFLKGKHDVLRRNDAKYYETRLPLSFNRDEKLEEAELLREKIRKLLGAGEIPELLYGILNDHRKVINLLSSRGRPEFGKYSKSLYGSAHDPLIAGKSVFEFAQNLQSTVDRFVTPDHKLETPKVLSAAATAEILKSRLREAHLGETIEVVVAREMLSDAAAGNRKIKLREDALFSLKDVNVFVYHEAFTHIATSLNGRGQTYAKFLGFDSPRCTATQEGLAVLMEIISASSYPARLRKIADRVVAVGLAERGAGPTQVFEFYQAQGYADPQAFYLMMRTFRGSCLDTVGPFTKDISYLKGFMECVTFLQDCLSENKVQEIQFLFAGKLALKEIPVLLRAFEHGLVEKPKWVPTVIQDTNALSNWIICASILGKTEWRASLPN